MTDARRKSASAPPFVRLAEDVDEERAIKQSATPPPAALAAAQQKTFPVVEKAIQLRGGGVIAGDACAHTIHPSMRFAMRTC